MGCSHPVGNVLEESVHGVMVETTGREIHDAKRVSNHLMDAFHKCVGLWILDRSLLWLDAVAIEQLKEFGGKFRAVVEDGDPRTGVPVEPFAVYDEGDVFRAFGGDGLKFYPAGGHVNDGYALDGPVNPLSILEIPGTKKINLDRFPRLKSHQRDWKVSVFLGGLLGLLTDLTVVDIGADVRLLHYVERFTVK